MKIIRTPRFDRRAKRAGADEDDVSALIRALIERPTLGDVIRDARVPARCGFAFRVAASAAVRASSMPSSCAPQRWRSWTSTRRARRPFDGRPADHRRNDTRDRDRTMAMKTRPTAKAKKDKTKRGATKRPRRRSSVARAVIASLEEIRAWQRGVGTVTVIDVPDPIAPARVKAIRRKLARSVRLFSERFGLPANTVRQWEQGARRPDTASSLLLEVIDANLEAVEAAAKRRRQAA
jgi:putative transcriptional regulator